MFQFIQDYDIDNRDKIFINMLKIVIVFLLFFSFAYFFQKAWFAAIVDGAGALILTPISYLLFKKNYKQLSKFIFVLLCGLYIYLPGLSFKLQAGVEYWFLTGVMLPFLIYDIKKDFIYVVLSLIYFYSLWFFSVKFDYQVLSEFLWAPMTVSNNILRFFNYSGAFFLDIYFVVILIQNIQKKSQVNEETLKQLDLERVKVIQNSKLASLGELSAGIAHEINNPLAIIEMSLRSLVKHKQEEEVFNKKIVEIERSIVRISKIVVGLRKFSRNSDMQEHKEINLSSVIMESLSLSGIKANKNGVELKSNLIDNICIFCNEIEIEQVLINLINNAIDAVKNFQDNRWVQVNLLKDKGQILIQIIDSGSGINSDLESKIFNPFFTTKPIGEGTGLGLSISKGILQEHNAEIYINRSFKNTCFEIKFNDDKI